MKVVEDEAEKSKQVVIMLNRLKYKFVDVS